MYWALTSLLPALFFVSTAYGLELNDNGRPKVVVIRPRNQDDINALNKAIQNSEIDFVRHAVDENSKAVIHVPSHHLSMVDDFMTANNLHETSDVHDMEELVNFERKHLVQESFNDLNSFQIDKYHNLQDINKYLGLLAKTYPKIAKNFTINRATVQGRKIQGIRIRSSSGKPVMMFECGIHAREWVAPASCLYIINQLVTRYSSDSKMKLLVDNYEWHIMPVANPDGYVYTFTGGYSRFWRKNRSKQTSACIGVDLNRNWEAKWSSQVGTSRSACGDSYAGKFAFSEQETQAVRDYVKPYQNRVLNYYSVHAFSQFWMVPYAYARKYTLDYKAQIKAAFLAGQAVKKTTGAHYRTGATAITIYPASGSSIDYFYDHLGIKFPFAVELRDTGTYGFRLPSRLIVPTGSEFFAGVQATLNYTKGRTF